MKRGKIFDYTIVSLVFSANPKESKLLAYSLYSQFKDSNNGSNLHRSLERASKNYPIYELIMRFNSVDRRREADLRSKDVQFFAACRHYLSTLGAETTGLPDAYVAQIASSTFSLSEELIMRFPTTEEMLYNG